MKHVTVMSLKKLHLSILESDSQKANSKSINVTGSW